MIFLSLESPESRDSCLHFFQRGIGSCGMLPIASTEHAKIKLDYTMLRPVDPSISFAFCLSHSLSLSLHLPLSCSFSLFLYLTLTHSLSCVISLMSVLSTFHSTIKPRSNNNDKRTHTHTFTQHTRFHAQIIFMKEIFKAFVRAVFFNPGSAERRCLVNSLLGSLKMLKIFIF